MTGRSAGSGWLVPGGFEKPPVCKPHQDGIKRAGRQARTAGQSPSTGRSHIAIRSHVAAVPAAQEWFEKTAGERAFSKSTYIDNLVNGGPREPGSPFPSFNSSPEVSRPVVMMYIRVLLSLRNGDDLLFERGIDIYHETVRTWWNRFGPMFARD